jgi:SAM-dependent methyltransferase
MNCSHSEAEKLFEEGLTLFREGKAETGLRKWHECIGVDPEFPEVYGHLAWHYFQTGKFELAREMYQRLLSFEPNIIEARYYLSIVLSCLGDANGAKREAEVAKQILRNDPEAAARWREKRKTAPETIKAPGFPPPIKDFVNRHRAARFILDVCRECILAGSKAFLRFYAPRASGEMLPEYCVRRAKLSFSISDYLSFLHRYTDCRWGKVGYSRVAEAALLSEVLALTPGMRVVDVGTGINPLPLYWARHGMHVVCTDPDEFVLQLRNTAARAGLDETMREGRLRFEVAEGRSLPFEDNTFDFWTSVSVVEHIPENGDAEVMKEAGRVLKPGGIAVATTEGGMDPHERWYRCETHFGKQYNEKLGCFWQALLGLQTGELDMSELLDGEEAGSYALYREYDRARLIERLVKPSGLELVELGFIDSRFKTDFRRMDASDPPWWGEALRQIVAPLCYWSYRRLDECRGTQPSPASIAYVILRKPN